MRRENEFVINTAVMMWMVSYDDGRSWELSSHEVVTCTFFFHNLFNTVG
jgi:hypothetical protein